MEWEASRLFSVRVSMGTLLVTVLLSFFDGSYCFENLCKRKTTILGQSSTQHGQGVSFANDGNLDLTYVHCSHTDFNRPTAWFQVDLGIPYSISNVKIYYRSEDSWMQYRFRQFYLDVSELPAATSSTSQRVRCYTDNTTQPNVPPNIIDIPCRYTARYVIVETTYDAPEDNKFGEIGPILEICEIEIYGCESGKYGDYCQPCEGCKSCDINSGHCECSPHYYGEMCDKQCSRYCIHGACFDSNVTSDSLCKCNISHELNAQVTHLQNANLHQHFYAVSMLFCLSLVINIFSFIRWIKTKISKCQRKQSRQNEKRGRAQTYENAADMETDYQNLSEMCLSQHHYEQVG